VIRCRDGSSARLGSRHPGTRTCQSVEVQMGETGRKSKRREGQGRVYAPLAIGSHRSCSLTSNSYPRPCACASSVRSIGWSSSGEWTGTAASSLTCWVMAPCICSGVDDMVAGRRVCAGGLRSNSLATTSLRTTGDLAAESATVV
jgi:hypothetical protein